MLFVPLCPLYWGDEALGLLCDETVTAGTQAETQFGSTSPESFEIIGVGTTLMAAIFTCSSVKWDPIIIWNGLHVKLKYLRHTLHSAKKNCCPRVAVHSTENSQSNNNLPACRHRVGLKSTSLALRLKILMLLSFSKISPTPPRHTGPLWEGLELSAFKAAFYL